MRTHHTDDQTIYIENELLQITLEKHELLLEMREQVKIAEFGLYRIQ